MLIFSTDNHGSRHPLCLLAYCMPKNFKPFAKPHGNSKCSKPYYATCPSTMHMLKTESKESGPKEVVSAVSLEVGGVIGAIAPGQLP